MLNKPRKILLMLIIAVFLIPVCVSASIVFETTGWITGSEGLTFNFTADQSPYTYQATLADLSEDPYFGFVFLFLTVSSSTNILGSILGPGSFTFPVEEGRLYFANVFGTGGGIVDAGLFGLEIATVPIPGAIWLLGSGLIGIVGIRRKLKK
jgi:hypothetical protein